MYHRVFEDDRSIDVVFSGASQTTCAIMDEVISEKLTETEGKQVNAVNFGYCRRGRDIQYAMLKDLFKRKHPKILVMEVYEDEPKKGHPVFPYLAESRNLFESMTLFSQRYFAPIWQGIVVRFEFFKNRLFNEVYKTGDGNDRDYGYWPSNHEITADEVAHNEESWKKRLKKSEAGIIRNAELHYSKYYLEKMIQMAEKENCKVVFIYFPEIGSNLKSPLLMNYYEQFSEVIVLPDEIVRNTKNWKDASHFNDLGALAVSEYIVPIIDKIAR